jgi:cytidylate kinase
MEKKKIIIAIDGYSSCGKSTLAKEIARKLNYLYLDSGAMYRAVTLYCLEHEINVHIPADVIDALPYIRIDFVVIDGINTTFLNEKNVEEKIRSLKVSQSVSEIARIPEVRNKMVEIQRSLGEEKGIVMDGRDITSVVFPDAELKIFVTADVEIRVQRRYDELISNGKNVGREEVAENLQHRDQIDTSRDHSPLIRVEDAFLLDNTYLNRKQQLEVALRYFDYIVSEK